MSYYGNHNNNGYYGGSSGGGFFFLIFLLLPLFILLCFCFACFRHRRGNTFLPGPFSRFGGGTGWGSPNYPTTTAPQNNFTQAPYNNYQQPQMPQASYNPQTGYNQQSYNQQGYNQEGYTGTRV